MADNRQHDFNCTRPSRGGAPPPPESGLTGECWCRKPNDLTRARELLANIHKCDSYEAAYNLIMEHDALLVAGAYEDAAQRVRWCSGRIGTVASHEIADSIRALTPADSRQALEAARLEGLNRLARWILHKDDCAKCSGQICTCGLDRAIAQLEVGMTARDAEARLEEHIMTCPYCCNLPDIGIPPTGRGSCEHRAQLEAEKARHGEKK